MNLPMQFVFALVAVLTGGVVLAAIPKCLTGWRKEEAPKSKFELFRVHEKVWWAPWAAKWFGADPAKEHESGPFLVSMVMSSEILANRPGANPACHPQAIVVRPINGRYDPLAKKVAWSGFWFTKVNPKAKEYRKERSAVA